MHLKEFHASEWPTHLGVPQDMPTKDTRNQSSKTRVFHTTKAGRVCQIPNEVMLTGVYAPLLRNEPMKTKQLNAASWQCGSKGRMCLDLGNDVSATWKAKCLT